MISGLLVNKEAMSNRLGINPLGIFATARDVALSVLYLASDESRYFTGSELVIDGGSQLNNLLIKNTKAGQRP